MSEAYWSVYLKSLRWRAPEGIGETVIAAWPLLEHEGAPVPRAGVTDEVVALTWEGHLCHVGLEFVGGGLVEWYVIDHGTEDCEHGEWMPANQPVPDILRVWLRRLAPSAAPSGATEGGADE